MHMYARLDHCTVAGPRLVPGSTGGDAGGRVLRHGEGLCKLLGEAFTTALYKVICVNC